jgi:hypothetical protein
MSDDPTQDGPPRVRMGRRERSGVILGLTGLQIAVIASAIGIGMTWMVIDADGFWAHGFVITLLATILGAGSYRRSSYLTIGIRVGTYLFRLATGQTCYLRDVWRKDLHTTMKNGRPPAGRTAPVRVGNFDLPGANAAVSTYQCDQGGAFTLDEKAKTASITFETASRAWGMLDNSQKESGFDGFVSWLSSLETVTGLAQMDIRIRVDAQPETELAEYVVAREAQMGDTHPISDELRHEYWDLIQAGAGRSMGITNQITLTFKLAKLRQMIRSNGGGLWGLSLYFNDLMPSITESVKRSGLEFHSWLTAAALEAAMARAFDPMSYTARMRSTVPTQRPEVRNPPVMGIHERSDRIEVDGTLHQVLWAAEWPRTERPTGFLERLLYAGDSTRTLLLQIRPVETEKALTRIARTKTGLEFAATMREKRGMPRSADKDRELKEVEEREEKLADGFADVEYRGFVTLSAATKDELNRARTSLEQTARSAGVIVTPMFFQQAAAFTTAVLPINAKG